MSQLIPIHNDFYPTHPQHLFEHLLLYTNEARQFVDPERNIGRIAIVPYGYHFYTGVVQAASYAALFANKNIKKVLLLAEDLSQEVAIRTTDAVARETWLGATLAVDQSIRGLIAPETISSHDAFASQIPFLHLRNVDFATPLLINPTLAGNDLINFLTKIILEQPDTAVILCQNLSDELPYELAQALDNTLITSMIEKETGEDGLLPEGLLGMIHTIVLTHTAGRIPHLYVNTGDVGDNGEQTSGYGSLVA